MVQLKTMAMKCRIANLIRKEIYKKRIEDFKSEDKQKLFDTIFEEAKKMHNELRDYKHKRRIKARIQKMREERKNLVK